MMWIATAKRAPLGMCPADGGDQAARIRFPGFSLREQEEA